MDRNSAAAELSDRDVLAPVAAELKQLVAVLEQWSSPISNLAPGEAQAIGEHAALLEDLLTLEQSLAVFRELQSRSIERLEALRDDAMDAFGDMHASVASALSTLNERAQSFASEQLKEIGDDLDEKVSDARESASDLLGESHADCVASLSAASAERIDQAGARMTEITGSVGTLIQVETVDAIHGACERAADGVANSVKQAADDALASVAAELAENVALSQLSTTVMATVSPILPQLVAAKVALSAIREALKILRMGF